MPGYLEKDGKKYCLIPIKLPSAFKGKEYFPGLQIRDTPTLGPDRSCFVDPFGNAISDVVPVTEDEFWSPHEVLYTVGRWPCYPLSFDLFSRLPLSLIDQLLQNTRTDWVAGKDRATYQVNWGGLTITKQYRIDEIGVGVAIWPRRVLKGWKQFFVLFAPGAKANVNAYPFASSLPIGQLEPVVYALADATKQIVMGDTSVVYGGRAAIARSHEPPRLLALKLSGSDKPEHGIMPLHCSADGTFAVPGDLAGHRRSVFADLPYPRSTQSPDTACVAVDFGTTNTAVAVTLNGRGEGTVLKFSDEILAKKLTDPWLDPSLLIDARFGFFPMNKKPTNPLPSVLVELDNRLEPFKGQYSLPRRSIPGDALDDIQIENFIRNDHLKQEFKWHVGTAGEHLRLAFLEMLARFIGLQLRTEPQYQGLGKAQVIFTCPLSFSHGQTEQLKVVQDHFAKTLGECGFEVSLRGGLVSESLANLCLIRNLRTGVGANLPEERHVVIDIGGGSTDISVFTGTGKPLWLDSLYIGGKDLPETVLLERLGTMDEQSRAAALEKLFGTVTTVSQDLSGGRMLQQLLLLRMERDMAKVATGFHGALEGTLADFTTLLAFATTYGVKMASLSASVGGEHIPEGTNIFVWFVGLGSRLFELSPLARAINDRRASATSSLEASCRAVVPASTTLTFDWRLSAKDAKLTVCKGALLVADKEPGLDLQTIFWAGFPDATPPIQWTDSYRYEQVRGTNNDQRRTIVTDELAGCVTAAVDSVSTILGFDRSTADLSKVTKRLKDDYAKGAARIAGASSDAPPHPIVSATDGLKLNLVGLMRRDERRGKR